MALIVSRHREADVAGPLRLLENEVATDVQKRGSKDHLSQRPTKVTFKNWTVFEQSP